MNSDPTATVVERNEPDLQPIVDAGGSRGSGVRGPLGLMVYAMGPRQVGRWSVMSLQRLGRIRVKLWVRRSVGASGRTATWVVSVKRPGLPPHSAPVACPYRARRFLWLGGDPGCLGCIRPADSSRGWSDDGQDASESRKVWARRSEGQSNDVRLSKYKRRGCGSCFVVRGLSRSSTPIPNSGILWLWVPPKRGLPQVIGNRSGI